MGSNSSTHKKHESVPSCPAEPPTQEIFSEQEAEVLLWQQYQGEMRMEQHWRQQRLHEEQRLKEAWQLWQLRQHQQREQLQFQQPASKPQSCDAVVPLAETLPTQQRVLPGGNAAPNYTVEWSISEYVKEQNAISIKVADNIVKLLQTGNTVPFIARYRKHMTGGMEADKLRKVKYSYEHAKCIQERAVTIIKEIHKLGQSNVALNNFILTVKSLNDLQDIHSMFVGTEAKLALEARDAGLETPANLVINVATMYPLVSFVKPMTEGLKTEEQVKDGIVHLLADKIIKDVYTIKKIKELRSKHVIEIHTMKANDATPVERKLRKNNKSDDNKYNSYNNFILPVNKLKPYQVLAINGGEARKILKVEINIPNQFEQAFYEYCSNRYGAAFSASPIHSTLMTAAVEYAYNVLIKPNVISSTRRDITEKAEIATMDNFAKDVKQILLTPPVKGKAIIGIVPGFQYGCKFSVVSEQGDELETGTIFPHEADIPSAKDDAERMLVRLVSTHKCTIFALGDGAASRETAVLLANLIQKGAFAPLDVVYQIVYDTGNSNLFTAASIARRLQDPMAELVNIQSKYFGLGMYDLSGKQLELILNDVVMEVVSFVGVDANTASMYLLKRVAGLDDAKAKSIVNSRKLSGPFGNRDDLKKVKGIGKNTFDQCAGFIRIMPETAPGVSQNAFNSFDQTWIHPESYGVAESFLVAANCDIREMGTSAFIFAVNLLASTGHANLAKKFGTTEENIDLIVRGLTMKKGQDIRDKNNDISVFRKSVTNLADLSIGTVLTGVVRNITHFGAFVDVGAEKHGMIHRSCVGSNALSVGQRVETKAYKIEIERSRLSLTLVK